MDYIWRYRNVCSVYTFPRNQILSVKVGKIHICHGKEGKLYVFTHTQASTHAQTPTHTHTGNCSFWDMAPIAKGDMENIPSNLLCKFLCRKKTRKI